MQVLLGWQCHMIGRHGLGYDEIDVNLNSTGDPDPVIPGALEEMTPVVTTPAGGGEGQGPPEAGVVLAGFRDCSEEAVRYLVEVEHMEEDDPLVVGLKKHLWERQQYLDVPRLLEEQGCGCGGEQEEGYRHRNYQQHHQHNPHRTVAEQSAWDCHTDPHHRHLSEAARWRLQAGAADTTLSDCSTTTEEGTDLDSSTSSSGSPQHKQSQAPQEGEEESTALSVMDLALLAQNNPAIASLTEEILSLLGGGEDSDLDESDLDLDMMDHSSDY